MTIVDPGAMVCVDVCATPAWNQGWPQTEMVKTKNSVHKIGARSFSQTLAGVGL